MVGRAALAVLTALAIAGCGGSDGFKGCAGAGVIVNAASSPSCSGRCTDYLDTLAAEIEAATPSSCTTNLTNGSSLVCLPSAHAGGCVATVDETTTLQAQIRDYLATSSPEIDSPTLETCLCHVD